MSWQDHPLRVMIVDDEAPMRALVRATLQRSDRARVVAEADGSFEQVAAGCTKAPQVVLLDQNLGGRIGTDLIGDILHTCPQAMIAVFSALDPDIEEAPALRAGAFTFYEKDVVTPALAQHLTEDYELFRRALEGEAVWAPSPEQRRRVSA